MLLLCLQLKQFSLGAVLVLCFSIGLALTLVASGMLAALSVKHVSKRWSGFGEFARKAPYFSGGLILLVGRSARSTDWMPHGNECNVLSIGETMSLFSFSQGRYRLHGAPSGDSREALQPSRGYLLCYLAAC